VDVKEVDEIDFEELKIRVENGDSVFITRKEKEKIGADLDKRACREVSLKL
jgi:hypothetical protein